MTREKWWRIKTEIADRIYSEAIMVSCPEAWEDEKKRHLQYTKEIDKLTEVYFMENTKK